VESLYEWDASGNAIAANIYGARGDEIIGRWDSSLGFLFYKQDKQGNVMEVLDQGGGIVEKVPLRCIWPADDQRLERRWGTSSAIGNRFMYTVREWIGELGIYDYRTGLFTPA